MAWSLIVAAVAGAGALLGGWFGDLIHRVSWDYIVVPEDYRALGLRLGLLAGTILAAALVVGERPLPPVGKVAAAIATLGVVAAVVVAVGGWASVALFEAGRLDTSTWVLPNPRRHALFLGLHRGVHLGPVLGALVAGTFVWRSR